MRPELIQAGVKQRWLVNYLDKLQDHLDFAVLNCLRIGSFGGSPNGFYDGAGAGFPRISFRYPYALHEGPYETLRWTFERLGNHAAAKAAEKEAANARRKREGK